MICISVVILTYNSPLEKLIKTLDSVIRQIGLSFEIVVSDDGSSTFYEKELEDYFATHCFINYKIIKSENTGTVRNYLRALNASDGKYVMGLGPGDLLFDVSVLHDVFCFCNEKEIQIGFGNSIYFTNKNGSPSVIDYSAPRWISPYNAKNNDIQKLAFFFCGYINGTSYFREKSFAIKYFSAITDYCRYAEDTPSTILALSSGIEMCYYNRDLTWYEFDSGVTSKQSSFNIVLENEYRNSFYSASKINPNDTVLRARLSIMSRKTKLSRVLKLLVGFPSVFFRIIIIRFGKKRSISDSINKYQSLLDSVIKN